MALKAFIENVMRAFGVDEHQVRSVSENMIWSHMVGRHSYGIDRIPILMKRVQQGLIRCPCRPRFKRLSDCMELLDGDDGFGQYTSEIGAARARELARAQGVGIVGVRKSNFFGTGAFLVHKIATSGMIGIVLSNSWPKVAPYGGVKAVLGTNPFAFGAPRRTGHSIMLDMSTATSAGSTVRERIRRGLVLPEGIAIDANGNPITDPTKVASGALLPFGGAKGYGLAVLVEILSGVITGAGISHGVTSMYNDFKEPGHNGHFLMALDIARWMPLEDYYERLEALIKMIKSSNPDGEVQLPGENRWRYFDENSAKGIPLEAQTCEALRQLAVECSIRAPWAED